MPKKQELLRLSPEEDLFLRHWMYEEVHYQGLGPAKKLQLQRPAINSDLAILVAAAFPDPADQEEIGRGPPPSNAPKWPWSEEELQARLGEARTALAEKWAIQDRQNPAVAEFLEKLESIPWFKNIGRPLPANAGVKRILRWEDWPGPLERSIHEL